MVPAKLYGGKGATYSTRVAPRSVKVWTSSGRDFSSKSQRRSDRRSHRRRG